MYLAKFYGLWMSSTIGTEICRERIRKNLLMRREAKVRGD
jgi:hypothetical protein